MYIWVGCKLPEDFETALRAKCLAENENIGLSTVAFDLPQHISLKISFSTDRGEEVLAWLREYLAQQPVFDVSLVKTEQIPGVLWLAAAENPVLCKLHRELDVGLLQFGVPQHPFDRAFAFHSSLFVDPDAEKLACMRQALRGRILPESLQVDTFLLGTSPDGKLGSYRVVAEIPAKKQ